MVEAGAGAPSLSGASIPVGSTGPALVRALLRRGAALGFIVMRTWAHSVNAQYALQTVPGKYSEAAFRGLDLLLDEARQANIKARAQLSCVFPLSSSRSACPLAQSCSGKYTIEPPPLTLLPPVCQPSTPGCSSAQLILAFTSNWTPTGGLPEYLKWSGLTSQSDFFTSPATQGMYKDFVASIINRRNTINGRLYRDDPTVMAWDLLNGATK